jgi:leucine dehydrogenase
MSVFGHPDFDDHQRIVFCRDKKVGLRAIIAIHNTNLGAALGGCRMWNYENADDALTDVLRLSRGMTYKAAMAGLALGGGKAVIIGDPKKDKSEALLLSFARFIDQLNGRYITAEDVGTTVADMDLIRTVTLHVSGLSTGAGNPSPSTARGVFIGIEAAIRHKLGKQGVEGVTVAVQGLGSVGYGLCRYLHQAGANLVVTDINKAAIDRAIKEFAVTAVEPDEIYGVAADVFAPCALGATINDETIPKLRARVIAGAANNQLAEERHGDVLRELGILYTPDYVINAGGLIDVARFKVDMNIDEARAKLRSIDDTLTEIFQRADKENKATSEIADTIAEERIGH